VVITGPFSFATRLQRTPEKGTLYRVPFRFCFLKEPQMAEQTSGAESQEKKPFDWNAVAAERAKAFGLPGEDLTREVQRELTARLAKEIVEALLKSAPFDYEKAGMTSSATW
jgi:hypothetical protein